jgi:hypothetical protein
MWQQEWLAEQIIAAFEELDRQANTIEGEAWETSNDGSPDGSLSNSPKKPCI